MASSLSRKLAGVVFSRYRGNSLVPNPCSVAAFCTKSLSSTETESDSDSVSESPNIPEESSPLLQQQPKSERLLENGLDPGIYKAILIGQVGQAPMQKKLRNGNVVTLVSLGTGGIRNNRRPLDNEEPKDYANRCAVQWHRVSIYPEKLGELAMKTLIPGSILYVEGNLETKLFNDPLTGLARRIREVTVRRNGRILFLGNGAETEPLARADASRVGYY
ncbi:single-stranded DNA-binding protein, mitochondrial [Andrographis paniculata]|uniref:single-stranded DNA-binding protein, mitochondrial n=1 Tax=Andrographis paniculata TaxID=175694 RepID=UPI0021E7AE34|nr:single-stranded DNA-binding protein, mitochondrial [Andrographis paniculata]XP_051142381.1 single-stranded DNA-binding protein, mitochondrial [Andrographis paniculata]XP_051142383.1 single-stranded DNA-binding protein, mitochondrial [Andrographis paniculata]